MKRLLVAVLMFTALIAAAMWATAPGSSHGVVTFTTEAPSVAPAEGMATRYAYAGKITGVHHRIRFTKVASRSSVGPCYRVDAKVVGDNAAIEEIVTGTGHYHWCVNGAKIVDRYTYANSDHTESWFWGLEEIHVTKGQGWSTTWCNDGMGPCFPVEYRYVRFTFRWSRGISVFGQDIKIHHSLRVACTVRGNPGGYLCQTGEA